MSSPAPPLVLLPVAGLANRLRAIAAAICAARELGRPLRIVWQPQANICGATAAALFDTFQTPFQVEEYPRDMLYPQAFRQCLSPTDWEQVVAESVPSEPIYIKSYGVFWQRDAAAWTAALRSIPPFFGVTVGVVQILNAIPVIPSKSLVGVHVRRTDNEKSCALSPDAAFFAKMDAYPEDTQFYLASDDHAVIHDMVSRYGEKRIHTIPSAARSRNTPAGIQAAFADMLMLSRCKEILGSAGSSFSEIAAAIGGRTLTVVTAHPTPNT